MAPRTPGSSSDPTAGRSGEPVTRRRSPTSKGGPGRIRVSTVVDGTARDYEGEAALKALPGLLGQPESSVWVDLAAPSAHQVEAVGRVLGLHPLIVEDVLEGNQRAKIESTDGVVHIVLFALDREQTVVVNEVDLVLGLGYLLTVHDVTWDPFVSHHLRDGVAPILRHGPDHLLWAIGDDIVDGYFPYADRLGDAIDEVQDAVMREANPRTLERLFALKRELVDVRRAASPTREVLNQLTNRELALIDPEETIYFRDIYDHVIRLTDELDNYRELAASTLDVYLTQVNNNLSVIMKRLTGVTVIVAGIGAVAGIFGMSEAGTALAGGEPGGFWTITALTLIGATGAALVLRRIGWI
ncbi:MAG TPA: magnesium transporter CorA family protein [Candidatus Limnocylindrales bacterium]|nr:magnesium transporter CorA family protein [Candidatus Limnocylindrales bacterium]